MMDMVSFEADGSYNYSWNVKNASLATLRDFNWIPGPQLVMDHLKTVWSFYLHYNHHLSPDCVCIYIRRQVSGDCGPQNVRLILKDIEIKGLCELKKKERLEFSFKREDYFEVVKTRRKKYESLTSARNPSLDILEFKCTLVPDLRTLEYQELNKFSSDMKTLYLREDFSDTRLKSGNAVLNVHRAIIASRISGLNFTDKIWNENILHITLPETDVSHFNDLLSFLYSAQVRKSVSREELIETAKTFGIANFEKKYSEISRCWNAETSLLRKRKIVKVNINDVNATRSHRLRFVLFGIPWQMNFCFSKYRKMESVAITLFPKRPVDVPFETSLLKFRIVSIVEDFNGRLLKKKVRQSPLKNIIRKNLHLCMRYKERYQRRVTFHSLRSKPCRQISFIIDFWPGTYSSRMKLSKTSTRKPLADAVVLGKDIASLYESGMFSDASVVVHGEVLKAHKAILCVRSTVFERMLEEIHPSEVIYTHGFKKDVMDLLLRHIYGSQINFPDTKMAVYLAFASDFYGLEILKARSLKYLADNLDIQSAFYAYIVFNHFQHEIFKNVTKDYIRQNVCFSCGYIMALKLLELDEELYYELMRDRKCICDPADESDEEGNRSRAFPEEDASPTWESIYREFF